VAAHCKREDKSTLPERTATAHVRERERTTHVASAQISQPSAGNNTDTSEIIMADTQPPRHPFYVLHRIQGAQGSTQVTETASESIPFCLLV
jgi:hypothetical protein